MKISEILKETEAELLLETFGKTTCSILHHLALVSSRSRSSSYGISKRLS